MANKELKKQMDLMWKRMKKDWEGFLKDSSILIKKGEVFLKDASKKGQQELESLSLSLQREKLYYELGKNEGGIPRKRNASKKKAALLGAIKKINEQIKKLKKAQKAKK